MNQVAKADSEKLREFAVKAVSRLCEAGYVAYFAGGCVRDSLLSRLPKDFDVATSALPEQVREVFGRRKTLAIGASFGVITVLGSKPLQVEVATFRNDGTYSDGRHPDEVVFSNAEQDALRRDFTINGMFFDPLENRVIDFVDGQVDLAAQVIRAIGDPEARIREDRLRMLRAVRFGSTYGFAIEKSTMCAIQGHAAKITSVSQERITAELSRMLASERRTLALQLLQQSQLLEHVLPEVDRLATNQQRWERLLALFSSRHINSFSQAISLIVGQDGLELSPRDADAYCRSMKLSNEQREFVVWSVAHREQLMGAHECTFSRLQPLLVDDRIRHTLPILRALIETDQGQDAAVLHCEELLQRTPEELNPSVLIRGNDLAAMGIKPGPEFKHLLSAVRDAQLDGKLKDRLEALNFVKQLHESR